MIGAKKNLSNNLGSFIELDILQFSLTCTDGFAWLWCLDTDRLEIFGPAFEQFSADANPHSTSREFWISRLHPCHHKTAHEDVLSLVKGQTNLLHQTFQLKNNLNQWIWFSSESRVYQKKRDGRVKTIIGFAKCIDDIKNREHALLDAQQRDYQALRGTLNGVWDWNLETGKFRISKNIKERLVRNVEDWESTMGFWWSFIHPDDKNRISSEIQAQINAGKNKLTTEYRIQSYDDQWSWITSSGTVIRRGDDNQPIEVLGTLIDITVQKKAEIALKEEKQLAQTTLESINEAVITTDEQGLITMLNLTAEKLLNAEKETSIGKKLTQLCNISDDSSGNINQDPVSLCLSSELAFSLNQLTLTNNCQTSVYIDCSVSPIHNLKKRLNGCVVVLRDVTNSREMSREMEHRAQHDALTNLYNRHAFERALNDSTTAEEYQHILCYIDLDQFKIVNDTCGHIAGDELLRQLSSELTMNVRKSDTLARLGGDEFGILFKDCDIDMAFQIASKIKAAVAEYTFHWEDKAFRLGASIGLSTIDSKTSPTLAMQHADAACFSAKEQGRNRIHVYRPDDNEMTLTNGQMGWVPRIQNALQNDLFELHVQAIVDLQGDTQDVSHFEVLIRLNENGEIIPPGAFLPAAERYNLSSQLDQWVVRNTLHTLNAYQHKITDKDIFNINLSAPSLTESGFLEFIQATFTTTSIQPSQICFEITETAAVTNLTAANHFIKTLKDMGCQFALDDFGSGLSSFGYLKNFPVDYLKIDGSFVKDITTDPIDAAMVKSINEIGQIMGKKTVAEWVENQTTADMLTDIGVNYAQGYHFSKPSLLIDVLADRPNTN
ncbi:MAG: hypothetical protein COB26_03465 [Piscirickettsiaceae bacterium]|nr:MAG: hypothetical protein COB89_03150 [Piscirickettsiaceae bacterium]PCI70558.1 MAG: hypothetical protein COB26_03465 [Piscirickettsiaceae bacterium]